MKMKYYFGAETAEKLGRQLDLDGQEYASWVAPRVDDLEIKDRVRVFAQGLRDRLPASYPDAIEAIVPRLGPELAEGEGYFNHSFHLWPVGQFIEDYGLEHPELSLDATEAVTRVFTGEWAIRPYLARYPELTLARVDEWSRSPSHNVRRLSTEGIRPRLPWAAAHRPFLDDPTPIIPILDRLYADPSRYVRTSVANNLNDIARTHPELAVSTVQRWLSTDSSPEVEWVAERGLRGLVKAGDPAALSAVGFAPDASVEVHDAFIPERIRIGETMNITMRLVNTSDQPREVLADYKLYFLKKNGVQRPSTFRFGRFTLAPGEERQVSKRHRFAITGSRTFYPGDQALSVVINGHEGELYTFELAE